MKGKEITVGILGDIPLPIIEIAPRSGFYDYHSKYTKGETQYIIPARLPGEKYLQAQEVSLKAFKTLGCSGCARVDVMTDEDGNPFVIDVNTMPGMTETSLVPQAAQHAGISFGDLAERILLGRLIENLIALFSLLMRGGSERGGSYETLMEILSLRGRERRVKGKRGFRSLLKRSMRVACSASPSLLFPLHRSLGLCPSPRRSLFSGEGG